MPPPPVTATYRFQLNPDFTLDHAADRLPYLVELGASHVYISPVLSSVPGSSHGYDVVDHSSVAEHLGGMAAFNRFTDAARAADLGVVLDIVPNHMSIRGPHNRRWLDVLEHGPSSGSASWFDIDWVGRERHQRGVLVLPVLDDLYGAVLASGVLTLGRRGSRFHVDCPGHRFPLSPRSLPFVLRPVVDELRSAPTASRDHVETLSFVVDALTRLEPATTAAERCRRGEHLRVLDRLLATLAGDRAIGEALDRALGAANAEPAVVHRVLEEQHYRLSYWRTALKELDYRRFFDVSDLAAIRTERDEVFDAVHALPLQWIGEGRIDGLRVDHPDGLADPGGYFRRLRDAAPDAWILAEKILEAGERLPRWPVDGTTGYDALRSVTGLLIDPAGLGAAADVERGAYERWDIDPGDRDPAAVIRASKRWAVDELLAADLDRVVDHLVRVAEGLPLHRDHSRADLRRAVAALAVGLDVYRTYAVPDPCPSGGNGTVDAVTAHDRAAIEAAADRALRGDPALDRRLIGFLADLLSMRAARRSGPAGDDERQFVIRFQQLTGPAMAKGLEDTAWYRLPRLTVACEVGGDPLNPAVSLDELHQRCEARHRDWPRTMTTLSTHDTKRSADVRARLAVLSEPALADPWSELAPRWLARLAEHWPEAVPVHAPTLMLALQAMIGAWPIERDRLVRYLVKAAREAKERTSWTGVDGQFEAALEALASCVDVPDLAAAFDAETAEIRALGRRNSLVQAAVALLQPGIPDTYQGSEGIDLSLVDPDNRRPPDADRLDRQLRQPGAPPDPDDPATKVQLTAACLRLRRRRPQAFGPGRDGEHRRLPVSGDAADRVVAFTRGGAVAVIAVRFPAQGPIDPAVSVALPEQDWLPVFGGRACQAGPVPVAELCASLPVAVLEAG